jgi:hypothetical protein
MEMRCHWGIEGLHSLPSTLGQERQIRHRNVIWVLKTLLTALDIARDGQEKHIHGLRELDKQSLCINVAQKDSRSTSLLFFVQSGSSPRSSKQS